MSENDENKDWHPILKHFHLWMRHWGFPWWLSDKEFACQCRKHGFDTWSVKIHPALETLTLCATTIDPELQSPWATATETHMTYSPSSTQEQPAVRSLCSAIGESLPLVTTRGSPQQQGPTIAKSKWIKLSKNLKIEWDTWINYRGTIKTSESNVMLIWLENRVDLKPQNDRRQHLLQK